MIVAYESLTFCDYNEIVVPRKSSGDLLVMFLGN